MTKKPTQEKDITLVITLLDAKKDSVFINVGGNTGQLHTYWIAFLHHIQE